MNLKEYLDLHKLNIGFFAVIIGIGQTSLYRFLRGAKPSIRVAKKIVKATNGVVTIEDLRGKDEQAEQ